MCLKLLVHQLPSVELAHYNCNLSPRMNINEFKSASELWLTTSPGRRPAGYHVHVCTCAVPPTRR